MSVNVRRFSTGVQLVPVTSTGIDSKGEMEALSTGGKLNYHNGTSASPMVTEAHSATLTNKTIDAASNTISNISDTEIKSGAAINATKIAAGAVDNTEFGYLDGVTSSIQTQLNAKASSTLTSAHLFVGNGSNVATDVAASGDVSLANTGAFTIASGAITNAKVNASAAIDFSKLAALTSAHILVGNGSNVAADVAVTGDVTISNAGVTAIGSNKVANSQLAQMAAHTFKGNNTGSTANALDLTQAQLTADLNQFTTTLQGVVPGSGGGSVNFLRADGTWATPPGSTSGTVTSVALSSPAPIGTVSGSPVTSSGTLTLSITASQAISSTAIDWSLGNLFTKTLGANTTFTFSNKADGQTIVVRLTNTASNYTVTWPTVKWANGAAPIMSTGAVADIYTFIYDGSNVYGSVVQNLS